MEGYSTIEQVATHYQVSISTVRSWVREKIIPFIKVGGMYRFRISEVDAAFLSRTGQPSAVPVAATVAVVAIPVAVLNPDQDV